MKVHSVAELEREWTHADGVDAHAMLDALDDAAARNEEERKKREKARPRPGAR